MEVPVAALTAYASIPGSTVSAIIDRTTAISSVYGWNGTAYAKETVMRAGKGYWIKNVASVDDKRPNIWLLDDGTLGTKAIGARLEVRAAEDVGEPPALPNGFAADGGAGGSGSGGCGFGGAAGLILGLSALAWRRRRA